VSSDQRKPKTYTLLYDVEEIEQKLSGILDKIKSADNLMAEMVKEAQEWRKHGLEIGFLDAERKLTSSQPDDPEILLNPEKEISNLGISNFNASPVEKQAENWQTMKLPIILDQNLIQCEFCQKQNKHMVFCNTQDLKSHILALHGGYPDYVR
jgi:hypothetical protein